MVYVAEDPTQPGAAWAICSAQSEHPKWAAELAKALAGYAREGAIVRYVTHEVGCEMLNKWERPAKKTADTTGDLFGGAA